jgi:photosystem II stability/assembly factor-like uncharacterized protein
MRFRRRWPPGFVIALTLAACGSSATSGHHPSGTVRTTVGHPPQTSTTSTAPATSRQPSPTGGPVPAGFLVQSATFVSADQGWVLGTAPCSTAPCTSIASTDNDGASWVGLPAPSDGLTAPTPQQPATQGVSEIRFADNLNGWVFGPDLWSTHNGGATWTQITAGPAGSQVVDLESSAGHVDVITEQCPPDQTACPAQLWEGTVSSDSFTAVAQFQLAPTFGYATPVLALHDNTGYLVTTTGSQSTGLIITGDGKTWTAVANPCPAGYQNQIAVAPVDTVRAAILCVTGAGAGSTKKLLLATSDAGHTWLPEGTPPPAEGDGGAISAADVGTLAIATSSGTSEIYRSSDGGASWSSVLTLNDSGVGWGDFGFTDATHGLAVHAPAARNQSNPSASGVNPATLFLTTNAGLTWSPVTI